MSGISCIKQQSEMLSKNMCLVTLLGNCLSTGHTFRLSLQVFKRHHVTIPDVVLIMLYLRRDSFFRRLNRFPVVHSLQTLIYKIISLKRSSVIINFLCEDKGHHHYGDGDGCVCHDEFLVQALKETWENT